jgi:thiamine biosynthesis protein ThiS
MQILLNGEEREIPEHCSLQNLLENLKLKPERLAIELNRKIVRRQYWPETFLRAGDRLEIVHFVGGG